MHITIDIHETARMVREAVAKEHNIDLQPEASVRFIVDPNDGTFLEVRVELPEHSEDVPF